MEANVMNQATVASIVTKYEQLAKNLREIAMDWHQGKLHPSFFTTFKFKDECGASCPIDLYKPLACNYNAREQDIEIKMVRQVIRADVDIISADPFTCWDINDIENRTEDRFWEESPRSFYVCTSKYQGVKTLAITKTGCLTTVNPNEPSLTDVPILMNDCC